MARAFYAHTLPGEPPDRWQPLEEHLLAVAERAGEFAAAFGARDWGYLAGLWHDLGKFSEAFQRYLAEAGADYHAEEANPGDTPHGGRRGSVDHTSAGAQHAVTTLRALGHLLAYAIAGHHAGLLDAIADGPSLDARLKKAVEPWDHGLGLLPDPPDLEPTPHLRSRFEELGTDPAGVAFAVAFFVRMVFSCVVDADFLDTEAFLEPERAGSRSPWGADILERMKRALDRYVDALPADETPVNRERRRVREACLEAATERPGLFSLTVPTGGGKTLSSLAFALRHARLHGLCRVVYVIPFTSIIEQNAGVFRRVFRPLVEAGLPDPVLEHHSALDAGKETLLTRLAAENWDAPLVVTTSVQFYESLFSHRPGRCRKLHNLARSVIILDEAQKIPVDHLEPCLRALRELAEGYGSTVVLCTATQPAVHRRHDFPIGLEGVREIVPDPPRLYAALRRVEVVPLGQLTDEELVGRLLEHEQVLCIVNTRRHARELYERLRDTCSAPETVIHLSAAMCPEHRGAILDRIRELLERGEPCRVVSTQLVEAGVDVDFPVVYRSLAGLDSIAQAAGRCNRNGRLARAHAYVFQSEHQRSEAFLRDTVNATVQLIGTGGRGPLYDDLLSLEAVEHYFRLYYWQRSERWDAARVVDAFRLQQDCGVPFKFDFRRVGERFRVIGDTGETVLVPWGERGRELCEQLRRMPPPHPRQLLRDLQRFGVQVHRRQYLRALGRTVELLHDRYPVLVSPEIHYDERLGLVLEREDLDPGALMI